MLRKPGTETGDAWDPTFGAGATQNITATEYRPSIRDNNGSLVYDKSYKMLVMPETNLVINAEDEIAIGIEAANVDNNTVFHAILDIQSFNPGGTIIFWELELAR